MSELGSSDLLALGFVDVGAWVPDGVHITYLLDGPDAQANEVRLDAPKALYAFVREQDVQYIGKTARTIRKRFVGYRRPGTRQKTNWRCNAKIKAALAQQIAIRIFVFTPIPHLRYTAYEIDLAAGLEDSLIKMFDPPWNGRGTAGQPVTEEAEREEVEEEVILKENPELDVYLAPFSAEPLVKFSIKLGNTYYNKGLINVGVTASKFLGKDSELIEVCFDDGSEPVVSGINRTANRSGGVRIVGRNQAIAEWFKSHFFMGDVVEGRIVDPNRVLLMRSP